MCAEVNKLDLHTGCTTNRYWVHRKENSSFYRLYIQPPATQQCSVYCEKTSTLKTNNMTHFMFCWPCILIYLCNENQLDALFIPSLFRTSTSTNCTKVFRRYLWQWTFPTRFDLHGHFIRESNRTFFFFRWRYSPLWALACRTIPLHFSLSITNFLHLLTHSTWRSLSTSLHPFLGLPPLTLMMVPCESKHVGMICAIMQCIYLGNNYVHFVDFVSWISKGKSFPVS